MSHSTDLHLFNQYNVLHGIDQGGKIIAEYVWIDGSHHSSLKMQDPYQKG